MARAGTPHLDSIKPNNLRCGYAARTFPSPSSKNSTDTDWIVHADDTSDTLSPSTMLPFRFFVLFFFVLTLRVWRRTTNSY